MKRATRASILALALLGGGCAARQGAGDAAVPATPLGASQTGSGVSQGTVIKCPVTGEDVTVTADALHSVHKGKDYYFCCAPCKASFDQDPERYLKGQ